MERKYSNTEVNRAGDFIAGRSDEVTALFAADSDEWSRRFDSAFDVIADWRSIHEFPLKAVSKVLTTRAATIDEGAIVAQRLKRYRSIRAKLYNSPVNNLTTMQDIAGCRAVLGTVAQAYQLKELYESHARARFNSRTRTD